MKAGGPHKSHPKTHMFVQNAFPADQMLLVLSTLSLMIIMVIGLSGVQFRESSNRARLPLNCTTPSPITN